MKFLRINQIHICIEIYSYLFLHHNSSQNSTRKRILTPFKFWVEDELKIPLSILQRFQALWTNPTNDLFRLQTSWSSNLSRMEQLRKEDSEDHGEQNYKTALETTMPPSPIKSLNLQTIHSTPTLVVWNAYIPSVLPRERSLLWKLMISTWNQKKTLYLFGK